MNTLSLHKHSRGDRYMRGVGGALQRIARREGRSPQASRLVVVYGADRAEARRTVGRFLSVAERTRLAGRVAAVVLERLVRMVLADPAFTPTESTGGGPDRVAHYLEL
jgi:hypothetical protein